MMKNVMLFLVLSVVCSGCTCGAEPSSVAGSVATVFAAPDDYQYAIVVVENRSQYEVRAVSLSECGEDAKLMPSSVHKPMEPGQSVVVYDVTPGCTNLIVRSGFDWDGHSIHYDWALEAGETYHWVVSDAEAGSPSGRWGALVGEEEFGTIDVDLVFTCSRDFYQRSYK